MPKLYYEEGSWIIPGVQGRKAERVDIPNQPGELATWLNDRSVSPKPGYLAGVTFDAAELAPAPAAPAVDERAARRASLLQQGAEIDVVCELIERAEGPLFARAFEAVICRLG